MAVKMYGWLVMALEELNIEMMKAIKEKEHFLVGDYIVYYGQYIEWGGVILNGKEHRLQYHDMYGIHYFCGYVDGIVEFQDNLYISENLLETVKTLADKLLDSTSIYPMTQLKDDVREEHRKQVLKRKKTLRKVIKEINSNESKTLVNVVNQYKYKVYEAGKLNGLAKFLGYDYAITTALKKGITYFVDMDDYGYVSVIPLEELETVTG